MDLPFGFGTIPLPAWMPPWVPALLLIPLALYGLLALLVPFNVFGVKSRLEALEVRLDDIERELHALVLRLPAPIGEDLPPVRGRVAEASRGYRAEPEFSARERDARARTGSKGEPRPISARAEPRIEPRDWTE
jgi:hypothetical protein